MSEDVKKIGRWLESTIIGEIPERLDEPFPVQVSGLDILRMRETGLLPMGVEKDNSVERAKREIRREQMSKRKVKVEQKVDGDFYILNVGLVGAIICTNLPIEEATNRLNSASPTGISSRWQLSEEEKGSPNHAPCPDNPNNTHYAFNC